MIDCCRGILISEIPVYFDRNISRALNPFADGNVVDQNFDNLTVQLPETRILFNKPLAIVTRFKALIQTIQLLLTIGQSFFEPMALA